jgi:hypothetical protein
MDTRWIFGAILLAASLVVPGTAYTQPKLTEVVFAREVANGDPVEPFQPGAYCAKDASAPESLPVINSQSDSKVVFWNRVESSTETMIRHTWYKDDATVAEVELKVGISPRWRTWSSKRIVAGAHAGKWKVEVATTADKSEVLCAAHFVVE